MKGVIFSLKKGEKNMMEHQNWLNYKKASFGPQAGE